MNKEKKHHKGESVIGKIIYGFLLFAPLISIGITCLVNVFNNTEQQEITINYKYETNEVNSIEDLVVGNIYHFDNRNTENTINFAVETIDIFNINFYDTSTDILNMTGTTISSHLYCYTTSFYLIKKGFESENKIYNNYAYTNTNSEYKLSCDFIYNGLRQGYTSYIYGVSKCENVPIESVETHGINRNETFNYAINQVEENNLFNWSKNSIIYTGMYEFTQALNVTNTFIPMLLTYWLLISVIYFLYDIVLMLVLIIHNRIHCLQDSI